jgi:hypothetical protein
MIVAGPRAIGWLASAALAPFLWLGRLAIGAIVLWAVASFFFPHLIRILPASEQAQKTALSLLPQFPASKQKAVDQR